jgi:hypothetical protein
MTRIVNGVAFRDLSPAEQSQFRDWARENYKPGEDINPCWHPVVQDECCKIELAALAKEALAVQDACNLTGVVHSFSRAVTRLRRCLPGESTRTYNTHPIVRAWIDKLVSLSGWHDEVPLDHFAKCADMAADSPDA